MTFKSKKPRYRPCVTIDWKEVGTQLQVGMPVSEIAACLGICPDTLYIRCVKDLGVTFSVLAQEKRAKHCEALRKVQYDEAINQRNTKILLHSFKHTLNQWDKQHEGTDTSSQEYKHFTDIMQQLKTHQAVPEPEALNKADSSDKIEPSS